MRTQWSELADTVAEAKEVTLGKTESDAQALVDNLTDTQAEEKAVTIGDTRGDGHANVLNLAC